MKEILSHDQVILLSELLVASGRVSAVLQREALFVKIGYPSGQLPINSVGPEDFAFVLVGRLNQAGDRETQ